MICLKSSLAFRQPAVAAASRRPAKADGPKVGLDGPASVDGKDAIATRYHAIATR